MSLQPCSLFILNLIWPLSASSSSLPLFSKESGFVVDLKQKEVGSILRAFHFCCNFSFDALLDVLVNIQTFLVSVLNVIEIYASD